MKKILIADSGATKTDWLLVDGGEYRFFRTTGLHPSYISERDELPDELSELQPDEVRFYGTGLGNPESDQKMRDFLSGVFNRANISIKSDLEGSGKAFFGDGNGVVAVLGTGSICAKIEKGELVKKSAALGFAIGDEGSAADLGRRILKNYYRNRFSKTVSEFVADKLESCEYGTMMNRIYRSGKPNRELASIAGEVLTGSLPEELSQLIRNAFQDFIDNQLTMLNLAGEEQIIFTGKVADVHRELLIRQMMENGYPNTGVKYPVIESFQKLIEKEGL